MKLFYIFLIMIVLPSFLVSQEIKKIKDIEIDTLKYLSTDDIKTKYDPTSDAKSHIKTKPVQHLEAGFSATSGNSKTTSFNAKYTFAHKTRIKSFDPMSYVLETSAFFSKDDGKTSAQEYKALFNLKQPLPKKWLSYLSLGWLKNDFQNFLSKIDLSIGIGKVLYSDKKQSLIVKLGPAINYERYKNGGSSSYSSLNEYIEYGYEAFTLSRIYLKIGAKENFSDMSRDYEINTLLGLNFKMDERLSFVCEYNAFYDNTPSEGFGKNDSKTVMRIGYSF